MEDLLEPEQQGGGEEEEEDGGEQQVVYCAVGKKEAGREWNWKANLLWVLANLPRRNRLVFLHLHRPASRINMMGAWVPVSQLAEQEVTAYRRLEEEKVEKVLDELLGICKSQKVNASKVTIASDDDTAKGLVQFVDDRGVTELVMGAASDRAYHRKMRAPRSKTALMVQRRANPSCKIWFVCRGNLICTREGEASEGTHRTESSSTTASPSRSGVSDNSRSKHEAAMWEDSNRQQAITGCTQPDAAVVMQLQLQGIPGGSDGTMDEKLKDAIVEAQNLKHEAYEETRRRQMAERDLAEANKTADEAERSCQREARQRKAVEGVLATERAEMGRNRLELNDMLEQIREADDRSAELELQIASSERAMSDLEARLSESYDVLDAAAECRVEEAAEIIISEEEGDDDHGGGEPFRWFEYSELDEATNRFDESARIDGGNGDGGRGKVYRGELRGGMAVAVKVLSPDAAVDEARFAREVEAIGKASRRPGLVAVVGACPAARAVVYELVPPGGRSLEEHLLQGHHLPWHARCAVAYRTCAALSFLHSSRVVHGDVRPANVLLQEHADSKMAGLGTRRLVHPRRSPRQVDPRGDVYSLGVLLLRLVTGRPPFLAMKAARIAAGGAAAWHEVVLVDDVGGAGGWPTMIERAKEVALVGLKCCDARTKCRPPPPAEELLDEVRSVLEDAVSAAPGRSSMSDAPPSYFVCPILKEVMTDPHIAGDGFSYEAEAIREWLHSGHDTSPMTNLRLPTRALTPNHALRSAVHEWRQGHAHFHH